MSESGKSVCLREMFRTPAFLQTALRSTSFKVGLGLFVSHLAFPILMRRWKRSLTSGKDSLNLPKPSGSGKKYHNNLIDFWVNEDDAKNDFLKDVLGEQSLNWVKDRNSKCLDVLGDPKGTPLYDKVLSILDSKEKIPYAYKVGQYYYNFWQDENYPRGIFRRISLEDYLNPAISSSDHNNWELVLDIGKLGEIEHESWVYQGYVQNHTIGGNRNRILLKLSRGGSDASVVREYDLEKKAFVEAESSEKGFYLPESKSRVSWKSNDVLLVGTDWKDDKSLTDSGYPRTIREWKRGEPLANAALVFEGAKEDVSITGYVSRHKEHVLLFRHRAMTFYTSEKYFSIATKDDEEKWFKIAVQDDAEVDHFADQLLISLRSDWKIDENHSYPSGALLAIPAVDIAKDNITPRDLLKNMKVLFSPTETISLQSFSVTKDYLLLSVLDSVKTKILFWKYTDSASNNDCWSLVDAEPEGRIRGISITPLDADETNDYWLVSSSFTQPSKLFLADAHKGVKGIEEAILAKQLTRQFDYNEELIETQYFATSRDGTKVPYFLISNKNIQYHGQNPTILYGYGGFEISLLPTYSSTIGACWLDKQFPNNEKHTVYVSANIRGGGEYGPNWHQSALRENRQKAYDDFIAIAEDLIQRRVTSAPHLGIRGGSNGGLLMGNMYVQRPDLFGAVSCAVPLLDMKAYNKLLAGASWMAEYGNPDVPEDWAFLRKYSAYHNLDPQSLAGQIYPPMLMTTSTRDDRVHPYHARAFVKRILDYQHQPKAAAAAAAASDINRGDVLYYENIEGGHGGAADNKQLAFMTALYIQFFFNTIGSNNPPKMIKEYKGTTSTGSTSSEKSKK